MNDVEDGNHGVVAGGVKLESFLNERSADRIDDDGAFLVVIFFTYVGIPERRMSRPTSFMKLLLHTFGAFSGGQLRLELIEAGDDRIHEIALGRVLESRLGYRDEFDPVLLQERFDGQVVGGVASQAICILNEYCFDGLIFLNTQQHVLQARAFHIGRGLAGIVIYALGSQGVFLAIFDGFFAKRKLRLQRVPVGCGLFFGRYACVDECFVHGFNGHSMQ